MRMIGWLAVAFIVLHGAMIVWLPGHAMGVSYAFLLAAPMMATVAMFYHHRQRQPAHPGWILAAASMGLWTLGMLASCIQDMTVATYVLAPAAVMLIYTLYGVPITYAIATVGTDASTWSQRAIDAFLALALGLLYFGLIQALNALNIVGNDVSPPLIAHLFDLENAYLAITALIRFFASDSRQQREFFGVLVVYTLSYALVAFYYNHHVALDAAPQTGSLYDLMVDVPFLLLAVSGLSPPRQDAPYPSPALARFVRTASPQLLALSVLVVAIFLMRHRFAWGAAGVVLVLLGSGLRSVLGEVRHAQIEGQLRDDQMRLAELAHIDVLTGVANRRAFEEAYARATAFRARRGVSLLMIDIDRFKQYNDFYGHPAGDRCLQSVARVLRSLEKRRSDVLARYGGEEFVLLMPDTTRAGALLLAQRLCDAVRHLDIEHTASPAGRVTVSIGGATLDAAGGSLGRELIEAADRALYLAKEGGRDRVEWASGPARD
ncbi:GGDEF domain-containing protein [Rhodanobacter sp. DHG33]|uniref:GGDEF domain-containing protein n=1 Tax=Rhodanobacter sp. DHG33 TaxID=2775921 RepID=UPI001784EE25|nr:GGDEF domain-containing protein [Rhodanobacter sp. DHG33]MBD8897789.1 GGDEF domain-containing protein [Rhodanobacter sp. DHG33]